jgi:hypothetical protein
VSQLLDCLLLKGQRKKKQLIYIADGEELRDVDERA